MKRFMTCLSVVVLAVAFASAVSASMRPAAALAAAPAVTLTSTTVLTTSGRTALTYTGYMNGESFQQDGITTFAGWQYAAFWDESGYVNVSRRKLPSGAWQNVRLTDYATTSTDSHNTISIGISSQDGTLHLAFDMHSSVLRYRRSIAGLATSPDTATWAAGSFGAVQSTLTGSAMPTMTYPQFLRAPGDRLQLAIRTGTSGSGDEVLYEYAGGAWSYVGRFIDGTTAGNNAYLFGIEYDGTDLLHVTWTVRETPDASTNHDIYYAYSKDSGRTWRNNAGTVVATTGSNPLISDAASLKVWSIGQNRGLINQESQVVDDAGVVHYWRDKASKTWHQTYTPFLERSSRGDIAADTAGNLYVASGDSTTHKLHIQTASQASGWTDWALRYTSGAVYFSDPLVDHERLRTLGVLSIFAPRYGGSQIDVQDWTVRP
jgi:BNR repeat-containing family member